MFKLCRYCGAEIDRAREPLETCVKCEDSPLCDRCGHPRADHSRVFTGKASAGCSRVVGDFQSLHSWRCDCEGFRPVEGALADATFAAVVEPLLLLRRVAVTEPAALPAADVT